MVYDELWDDLPIWVPAKGNFVNLNHFIELQRQLREVLKPRTMSIPMASGIVGSVWPATPAADDWLYYLNVDPPFWQATGTGASSRRMFLPLPWVRTGWKLTALTVFTSGTKDTSGGNDGSIKLYRHALDTAGSGKELLATISGTIFRVPYMGATWGSYNAGALTHVFDATYGYYLELLSAYESGVSVTSQILGAYATVQLGN